MELKEGYKQQLVHFPPHLWNPNSIIKLLPPAYGVWREGNVFSLSVHRGAPQLGGRPQGYPPNWGGRGYPPNGGPEVPPQLGGPGVPPTGGRPRGYPPQVGGAPLGVPPPKKNGQSFGQKMDKKLDKHFGNFWRWGGAGGTPLAVTQEDCLVSHARAVFFFKCSFTLNIQSDQWRFFFKRPKSKGFWIYIWLRVIDNIADITYYSPEFDYLISAGWLAITVSDRWGHSRYSWSRFPRCWSADIL